MEQSLFNRYGGFATVRRIVSAFYDRVLDSPVLQGYFANTDMRALIDHQTKFIAYVMGGPSSFSDEALQRAHARLNISQDDMREMARLMRETRDDFGFSATDAGYVENEIMRRAPLVVTRH